MSCVWGAEAAIQSGGNSQITQDNATAQGSICERQLSSSWKESFFLSYPETESPFLSLCILTETMKNVEFLISAPILLAPSFSHTYTLFFSVSVAAAAACLPVCLFLEAHNMADMCFVIVSTTSSLLAYKGCLSPPHPTQNNTAALKIY